jgi:Fur family transcriptional regulator, ferric uptake regulator
MASLSPVDELHAAVGERLRSAQQVYTQARRRLVELLVGEGRPLTAPELIAGHPELSQSSAYRNLAVFESLGIVVRIATDAEHARFELAEDLMGHHHHLICTECGRVEDFIVGTRAERSLDRALTAAVAGTGFVSTGHRLDVLGSCRDCQRCSA